VRSAGRRGLGVGVRSVVRMIEVTHPRHGGITDGGERSGPRVLMLTTFDHDEYVYEALRAGASGFLLKTASATALADAIRVVAAGHALLAPSVTRRLIAEFSRLGRPRGPDRKRLDQLTEGKPRCWHLSHVDCPMRRSPATWLSPSRR
jgi:DNA-binding NarL/FixJ family response regulator